jgi:hypothetical protein
MNDYDELAARLRAADPAASLPPADADRVARLLEETMIEDHPHTATDERRPLAAATRRARLLSLGLAAAALVVGGVVANQLLTDDSPPPSATSNDSSQDNETGSDGAPAQPRNDPPTVTELTLGDDALLKCRVPDVEVLRSQSVAVDATVSNIDGQEVTFDVTQWFRGEPTDQLELRTASPELRLALSGVEFEEGGRYLVSALDGQVTLCGFSAEYNRDLARLYQRAYAG